MFDMSLAQFLTFLCSSLLLWALITIVCIVSAYILSRPLKWSMPDMVRTIGQLSFYKLYPLQVVLARPDIPSVPECGGSGTGAGPSHQQAKDLFF